MATVNQILSTFNVSEEELNLKLKKFGLKVSQLLSEDQELSEATFHLLNDFLDRQIELSREEKINYQFKFHKARLATQAPKVEPKKVETEFCFGYVQSLNMDRVKPCLKISLFTQLDEILKLKGPQKTFTFEVPKEIHSFKDGEIVIVRVSSSQIKKILEVKRLTLSCFIFKKFKTPTEIFFLNNGLVLSGLGNTRTVENSGFYSIRLSKNYNREEIAFVLDPVPISNFKTQELTQVSRYILSQFTDSQSQNGLVYELLNQAKKTFSDSDLRQIGRYIFTNLGVQNYPIVKSTIQRLEKIGIAVPDFENDSDFSIVSGIQWLKKKFKLVDFTVPKPVWNAFIENLDSEDFQCAVELAFEQNINESLKEILCLSFKVRQFKCLNVADIDAVSKLVIEVQNLNSDLELSVEQVQTDKAWIMVRLWSMGILKNIDDHWFEKAIEEISSITAKKQFIKQLPEEKQWICLGSDLALESDLQKK